MKKNSVTYKLKATDRYFGDADEYLLLGSDNSRQYCTVHRCIRPKNVVLSLNGQLHTLIDGQLEATWPSSAAARLQVSYTKMRRLGPGASHLKCILKLEAAHGPVPDWLSEFGWNSLPSTWCKHGDVAKIRKTGETVTVARPNLLNGSILEFGYLLTDGRHVHYLDLEY